MTNNKTNQAEADFEGVFDTVTDDGSHYELHLDRKGNRVVGEYSPKEGSIQGRIKGNVLSFEWKDEDGQGSGRFELSEDGGSFEGRWSAGDTEGEWDGTRM